MELGLWFDRFCLFLKSILSLTSLPILKRGKVASCPEVFPGPGIMAGAEVSREGFYACTSIRLLHNLLSSLFLNLEAFQGFQ